jgi:hypothetical protein
MVKNIPTIERSTKIRFGKHATDDQAENTIVFNASDTAINASTAGSMYMSPLREAELAGATFIGYSSITKEVVDTGVATSLLGGVTLDSAGVQGNVISNSIPHFANTLTAFTTGHGSNVGISNTAPTHMLSVGDKIFMSNTGAEAIKVEGNVRANRFFVGTAVTISGSATNKIQVSGKIKTGSLESTDSVAVSNNQTVTKLISVGTHTFIHNPSATESAITTSGNVSAAFYKGDAGLLSNVIHTGTLPISKGGTGQTTASAAASALGLGVGDQPSFVTVNANVNASNIVTADGRGINQLNASNVSIGTIAIARGGTGADSAAAAASALGLGVGDQPSFVTMSANVNASNIVTADGRGINQLNASNVSIGTIAIARGGTGADSAAAAASALGLGVEDQPSFVTVSANVNASNIVSADGRGINQLNASNVSIGTIAIARGGTGQTTASAAASALGLGVEDQPSFVTVTANVIAHNVASTSLTTGILPYVHSTKQLRDSKLSYNDATYVTSLASNLVITGNLYVQGSTTFQHSNIHSVSDPIIEIGNANVIDTIDMGIIMTRPTANVAAGFRGNEKEYTIAFTLSDPDGAHIVPTMATSDGYITANVWGNVLSGNVTSTGLIHGGTLKGDGSAITVLNMGNAGSGSLAIARGGTGQTTASAAASALGVGAEDQPSFVTVNANVNAGNVVTTTIELGHASDTTLARSSAGVVTIEGVEIRTGTVPIGKGGTGAGSASAAASALGVGTEDQPSFVTVNANVNAGNVVTTTIELGHASDTTLARSSAGVVTIEGVEIRTGTIGIGDGGTGTTSASAAASALGVGTEDQPSFVTINANVNAGNVTSASIKLTDPGIIGSFSTDTITINAENRTYGTAPLVVATGDIDKLNLDNLIDGAQVVISILASGGDRAVSKDLTNVNFTVLTEDVSITQNKHGLMTLSNIAGNVYMNTIAFS